MDVETWLALPTADWGGTLVGLSLGLISAAAAVYTTVATRWAGDLKSAIDATSPRGQVLDAATTDGARALAGLESALGRDPAPGLGLVVLVVTVMMAFLGVVGGARIPNVGFLFTVIPVVVATVIAGASMYLPGRRERVEAQARVTQMKGHA
jgi:hypothetical protein